MERLTEQQQDECRARQAMAPATLSGHTIHAYPTSFHLWLRLPEPWRSAEFTAAARRRGVAVTPAEAFALGRGSEPLAVRLCLVGATDRAMLAEALERLATLLAEPAESYLSVV
jgi:DNA-binding transcriptional MocR family regulator